MAFGDTPSVYTQEITMTVGELITLRPYEIGLDKSQYDTYEMSDPDAFIVNQGYISNSQWGVFLKQYFYQITALKKGTYTFTVTQHRTDSFTGGDETAIVIYTITVNGFDVTSITLNETEGVVCVGGKKQLEATIEPSYATDPSVTWYSFNDDVATVNDNGLVTGVNEGVSWITATTNDGTNLTAMCKMTVKTAPTSVKLNYMEADVHMHQTLQLNATILPSTAHQEVVWTSSNADVATVSESGLVTPISLGNAIITASTVDGSNKKAMCVITVLPAVATEVHLNQTAAGLKIGQTLQLNATVIPSDASQEVEWKSSNTTVATVNSNGLVTAVNLGDATVTATTKDGTNLSASCEVTVAPEFASNITLNHSSINMHFGETSQLEATITPSDASQTVTWTSSDPSVLSVDDNGLLFAKALGNATVTATTTDGTNLSATCSVTVSHRYTYSNDVDCDGTVTAADITALYDYLLDGDMRYISTSDVNDDGSVNAADITSVYEELLNGSSGSGSGSIVVEYEVNGVKFNMVRVEGGTFLMGATPEQGNEAASNEMPAHEVTLSPYFIGETEVTQELWKAVMGSNPSNHKGDLYPVEKITWYNCSTFVSKLNQMTGKNFRLPTEAEWEYAARGGNKSKGYKYSGSDNLDDVAWNNENSGNVTHEVSTKTPNELGIYDMSGNVWEWCQDILGNYNPDPQTNPTGATSGSYRVFRGGKFNDDTNYCRVSYRAGNYARYSHLSLGVRLALSEE